MKNHTHLGNNDERRSAALVGHRDGLIDRATGYLLPPSVDEWLPERHLARFIVEVIDRLDLSAMSGSYRGTGSAFAAQMVQAPNDKQQIEPMLIGSFAREPGQAGHVVGRQRLLQRSQCGAVRCGADRSDDCAGLAVASSVLVRALCQSTAGGQLRLAMPKPALYAQNRNPSPTGC
jgi:hypothetical protein